MDLEELTPKLRVLRPRAGAARVDRGDRGGEISFAFQEQGAGHAGDASLPVVLRTRHFS